MPPFRTLPRLARLTAPPCFFAIALAATGTPLGLVKPHRPGRPTAVAAPVSSPVPEARARNVPAKAPSPEPAAAAKPHTVPRTAAPDRLEPFRGLGAWIDLYDFGLSPKATITTMRRHGVRTLYIQTGRSNTDRAVDPKVGPWLREAQVAGMKVVGWYLPSYESLDRDVRRTVAIERYRYGGHRFDGAGIDIEFRGAVESRVRWMRRVAAHAKQARAALGTHYPLASITPTPLQMRVAPGHWAGFPWRRLARSTDAVLLMSYWSDRMGCPEVRRHCAYEFTAQNVRLARLLSGRPRLFVHVIGGVGDSITARQLRAFVRAVRDARANGASIYDVATTKSAWWRTLAGLRALR